MALKVLQVLTSVEELWLFLVLLFVVAAAAAAADVIVVVNVFAVLALF